MRFSFAAGEHKFKCVQCGNCCYPGGLSLTPAERKEMSGYPEAVGKLSENLNPPFSHILVCKGRCPFLNDDMLCNIYDSRPGVCVSFPLTFTYSPQGELCVNFIRCPGTDAEDGEAVDEKFVEKTMAEVEKRNPGYFEELKRQRVQEHQLLSPFYSQAELTDFDSKQRFKERLAQLMILTAVDGRQFRSSCHAFLNLARQGIESEISALGFGRGNRKTVLFEEDIARIEGRVEREIENSHEALSKEYEILIDQREREALRTGSCEIYWEGEVKKVKLEEQLETRSLTGKRVVVKASSVYLKREFSTAAFKTLVEHLAEALVRVDLGGFPMSTPTSVLLQVLGDYVNNLEIACYIYSQEGKIVPNDVATSVVNDYDTFFVLGGIHAEGTGAGLPQLR